MANEIYDSTWWGNTIETASSIGTSTEMIQGQFNLTKLGDELVTNGDFATDTDWVLSGQNLSISNGKGVSTGSNFGAQFKQTILKVNKSYKLIFDIVDFTSGSIGLTSNYYGEEQTFNSLGTHTAIFTSLSQTEFRLYSFNFIGTVTNVSVKEVRATTVEASKCLADAIHRIGIQDIQN